MPFVVEHASTGRAKCKDTNCKKTIDSGALRIGKVGPSPFGDGEMTQWYHAKCFFGANKRARSVKLTSLGDLEGFKKLKKSEQDMLTDLMGGKSKKGKGKEESSGSDSDDKPKKTLPKKRGRRPAPSSSSESDSDSESHTKCSHTKRTASKKKPVSSSSDSDSSSDSESSSSSKPKKKPTTRRTRKPVSSSSSSDSESSSSSSVRKPASKRGKTKSAAAKREFQPPASTMQKLSKEQRKFLEGLIVKDLKAKLQENDCVVAGAKAELQRRVAYNFLNGVPPRCPTCSTGHLKRNESGGFYCPGAFEDDHFVRCDFVGEPDSVKTEPWKVVPAEDPL